MLHSSHGIWRVKLDNSKDIIAVQIVQALRKIEKQRLGEGKGLYMRVVDDFEDDGSATLIRVDFFTPGVKFLDCLKLWVPYHATSDNVVEVAFFIESSGICPLIVPGAPLISTLLCWIPFQDDKQMTKREMAWLVEAFDETRGMTSELNLFRGSRMRS
jgi:hypothetical protein